MYFFLLLLLFCYCCKGTRIELRTLFLHIFSNWAPFIIIFDKITATKALTHIIGNDFLDKFWISVLLLFGYVSLFFWNFEQYLSNQRHQLDIDSWNKVACQHNIAQLKTGYFPFLFCFSLALIYIYRYFRYGAYTHTYTIEVKYITFEQAFSVSFIFLSIFIFSVLCC